MNHPEDEAKADWVRKICAELAERWNNRPAICRLVTLDKAVRVIETATYAPEIRLAIPAREQVLAGKVGSGEPNMKVRIYRFEKVVRDDEKKGIRILEYREQAEYAD